MVEHLVDGRSQEDDRRALGRVLGDLGSVEGAAKLRPFVIDVLVDVERNNYECINVQGFQREEVRDESLHNVLSVSVRCIDQHAHLMAIKSWVLPTSHEETAAEQRLNE